MNFKNVSAKESDTKAELLAALTEANSLIDQANAALADMSGKVQAQEVAIANLTQQLAAAGKSEPVSAVLVSGTHLRISSAHPSGSHWRIGRLWGRQPVDVAKDTLTPDQIDALRNDRSMVVVDL